MSGVERIRKERARQRAKQGERWSAAHDDGHDKGEIALAAAVYAMPHETRIKPIFDLSLAAILWPWPGYYKPKPEDRIRELEKAGALIAAEIDRLLRASALQEKGTDG